MRPSFSLKTLKGKYENLDSKERRRFLVNLSLSLVLVISLVFVTQRLVRFFEADELVLPAGFSPLEYAQALSRADVNNDGVINLFDYALATQDEYGTQSTFQTADVNIDQRLNAIDTSFLISHAGVDVEQKRNELFQSPQYRDQINREIARRNEDTLPALKLNNDTLAITSEDGGSEQQYGTTIIPKILGSVSSYSGAAIFDHPIVVPEGPGGTSPKLSISYSTAQVDDARNNGTDGGKPFYGDQKAYIPSQVGHGFALGGIGSIERDIKEEKDLYKLKGELYHRFILNIPGGVSAELRYNPSIGRWTSAPHSFLKIEHRQPERIAYGDLVYMDPSEWEVTTPDGARYYFGEKDLSEKFNTDARIHGSDDVKNEKGELIGTKDGNAYLEFDKSHLCAGKSELDPCKEKEKNGKVALVTKWLLRKIVTSDGKEVLYTYDSQQRYLGKPWNGTPLAFVSSTSYPKEISWNDGKHRVVFQKEGRPDMGSGEYMRSRIKKIRVETKLESDNSYHLVRSYVLSYYDGNDAKGNKEKLGVKIGEISNGDPIDNEFHASFLTQVQMFGSDDTTSEPVTTFQYAQYRFAPQGYHGGEIYLSSINNGLGGINNFAYQPYAVNGYGPKGNLLGGKNWRVRVIQAEVVDLVQNKKSKVEYEYGEPKLYVDLLRKAPVGEGGTAVEFLGHDSVTVKSYDFDGSLLSQSKSEFYQANVGEGCFEPHPAKGQSRRSLSYAGNTDRIVSESLQSYHYRHDGVYGQDTSGQCNAKRIKQPLFVYPFESVSIVRETAQDFIPAQFASKVKIPNKSEIRTLQRSLAHDDFGNVLSGVAFGEVDGSNKDIDTSDNTYQYSYFLTSGSAWIKKLQHLSYVSPLDACGPENLSCQWGRTKSYYDNFDKNYWELSMDEQQPKYGLLTQKETWIDDTRRAVEGYVYVDLSGDNSDADVRKGGIETTYGPRPNIKHVSNPKEDLMITSKTTFDPYYHTLAISKENTLGHKQKLEDYDFLLQMPRKLSTQIQTSPEMYNVSRMEFDSIGRLKATFSPDPQNPGTTMSVPSALQHDFERGSSGMVKRSAKLVSLTSDGTYHYQVADQFYDGMGLVIQVQALKSQIEGKDVRLVTDTTFHADGKITEKYDNQTTNPIDIGSITATNYSSVLSSIQPQYEPSLPKQVVNTTTLDELRRPLISTSIDINTGKQYASQTKYALLSEKTTGPKGNVSVMVSDVWGRQKYSFTSDPDQKTGIMTENLFEAPMLTKPTRTILHDTTGQKVEFSNEFDKSGRILVSSDPSLGTYRYDYDLLGNKILEKSQPREDILFEYDDLGRLKRKVYDQLEQGEMYAKTVRDDIEYEYDQGAFALGKLTKVSNLIGERRFEFDSGQRQTVTTSKIFDKEKVFKSEYNQLSHETKSIYPDNTIYEKEYDASGSLSSTKLDGKTLFLGSQSDKRGNPKVAGITFGEHDFISQQKHDGFGKLTSMETFKKNSDGKLAVGGNNILGQTFAFGQFGEISSVSENILGLTDTQTYSYDAFSQLTGVSSNAFTSAYEYDMFGRMLSKKENSELALTYTTSVPFFAPKSVTKKIDNSTTSFDYTPEGNVKSDENNCYAYNREGQLIALKVKKEKSGGCDDQNSGKVLKFYYDDSGAMSLQEEYDSLSATTPKKQVYLFGNYEEEITN